MKDMRVLWFFPPWDFGGAAQGQSPIKIGQRNKSPINIRGDEWSCAKHRLKKIKMNKT